MCLRSALPAALLLMGMAGAWAQTAAPPAEVPPCVAQYIPLRQDMEKRFIAAKTAIDRKAPATELCTLLTRFTEAESKVIKYAEEQGIWCEFPPQLLQGMKASQVKSQEYRKQACTAASQPRKPAAPSLSDALGAPVPDASTTRTGRGTFDSLGGNPLAR